MFVNDPDTARAAGQAGRNAALLRFGADRFLSDWDQVFDATVAH